MVHMSSGKYPYINTYYVFENIFKYVSLFCFSASDDEDHQFPLRDVPLAGVLELLNIHRSELVAITVIHKKKLAPNPR